MAGDTGLDFGPWADGLTPGGGTAGFAQLGWPAGRAGLAGGAG
jgi:hypothetical protein